MKGFFASLLIFCCVQVSASNGPPSITETMPHLIDLTFKEPKSSFYVGFGLTPVAVLRGRMLYGINFFQLHWIRDMWDIEILNASYGIANAQPVYLSSRHFMFRSSPKIRFFKMMSIGPVFGYEFVSFPEVDAKIYKAPWQTPNFEPFSSKGPIYGVMVSQTFSIWTDYILKVNEAFIKQTYSTDKTDEGWEYLYDKREIRNNKSALEADTVMMLEFSLLF
jgi:hypothetical protein